MLDDGATKAVGITRAHLEEDAGKSLHEDLPGMSGIDLNRAGTPLLEIVSEPDMRSAEGSRRVHEEGAHARALPRDLRRQHAGRLVPLRRQRVGAPRRAQTKLGTRAEIKNLNSFRFVEKAINYEVARQIELLEAGGKVVQETRLYDPDKGETRLDALARKRRTTTATSPIRTCCRSCSTTTFIDAVRATLPELPDAEGARASSRSTACPLTTPACSRRSRELAEYYEEVAAATSRGSRSSRPTG